jgi:enoyl-CoA hydratase/carnithine racemase
MLDQPGFPVRVVPALHPMDGRLFRPEPMGISAEFRGAPERPDEEARPPMTDPGDPILTTVGEGVAVLTLNNPPLNLVTLELTRRLGVALDGLAADPAVRVLVVTGAGTRAFCAGSDVAEFAGVMDDVVTKKLAHENAVYRQVAEFPRPTIAALNGLAYGGGLELAVCCDILIAGADVRLALPEVKLGVLPGSGGTIRVPRRVGEGRAKELMFVGEPIDAPTALTWGLINRVVEPGQALARALDLARVLAERPGRALGLMKRAVALARDLPESEAVTRTLTLSAEVFATEDCREGVRAFFAKEPPRFRHR